MTDDEIQKLEDERLEVRAALREIGVLLRQSHLDKATADMAAKGISIGDAVEVSTGYLIENGVIVGFEGDSYSARPVIRPMKKDGTASKRGRVFVWHNCTIRKLDQ